MPNTIPDSVGEMVTAADLKVGDFMVVNDRWQAITSLSVDGDRICVHWEDGCGVRMKPEIKNRRATAEQIAASQRVETIPVDPGLRELCIAAKAMADAPTVYVVLDGGLVQSVYCDVPINVEVLDVDKNHQDEDAEAARVTLKELEDSVSEGKMFDWR